MTAFSALVTDCRELIGDTGATVFSADQLKQWVNDAIKQLSIYFPRRMTTDIDTTTDQRKYNIDVTTLAVLSCEYPADQDPPVYCQVREYTHPNFWTQDGFYCLVKRMDAYLAPDPPSEGYGEAPQIWVSRKPLSNEETIRLEYLTEHDTLSADADVCTVLPRHEHLIHLFVRWKAWSELATTEGMDPDPTELLNATFEVNAGRAEKAYREALRDAQKAESDSGQAHLWMDKWDRIY